MDDDVRLIRRAGHRRLADDDFADIFDFADGRLYISLAKSFVVIAFVF